MSNSKQPLTITIDNPRRTYIPGDVVSGKVRYVSTNDEAIGTVTITFVGRAETHIANRDVKHAVADGSMATPSVATLVEQKKELYSSHYTLRADVYEWPFDFVIPATASSNAANREWKEDPAYETSPGHTLPPTMVATNSTLQSMSFSSGSRTIALAQSCTS